MTISPYSTLDNVIEGVGVRFVDITKAKLAQAALVESEARRHQIELAPQARDKS